MRSSSFGLNLKPFGSLGYGCNERPCAVSFFCTNSKSPLVKKLATVEKVIALPSFESRKQVSLRDVQMVLTSAYGIKTFFGHG